MKNKLLTLIGEDNFKLVCCCLGVISIMNAGMESTGAILALPLVVVALMKTQIAYLAPFYPFIIALQIAVFLSAGAVLIKYGTSKGDKL